MELRVRRNRRRPSMAAMRDWFESYDARERTFIFTNDITGAVRRSPPTQSTHRVIRYGTGSEGLMPYWLPAQLTSRRYPIARQNPEHQEEIDDCVLLGDIQSRCGCVLGGLFVSRHGGGHRVESLFKQGGDRVSLNFRLLLKQGRQRRIHRGQRGA
ncbi:hypothetical protein BSKO_12701 [Bryopsis sp. KO-2023]|nr:hypothetical protein BSKO_12701 [Bryopsis sp. KO-2023]